jgi:quercetin dioxygenase-like cupin family protein
MIANLGQTPAAAPEARLLSSRPGEGPAWWFAGTLTVLRNPEGAPRTPAVIEMTVPPGVSPPLHVHDTLDDSFLMLEGQLLVRCGETTLVAGPGDYVVLPAGVEHTFRVIGEVPARVVLVHGRDDFLNFIEAVGTPAPDRRLPPREAAGFDREAFVRTAAQHALRIIGPPMEA